MLFSGSQTNKSKAQDNQNELWLSVFEGDAFLSCDDLYSFPKQTITFGRDASNDIVIPAAIVSRNHGWFTIAPDGSCYIHDGNSTNGLLVRGDLKAHWPITPGEIVSIGKRDSAKYKPVIFLASRKSMQWDRFDLASMAEVTIGRDRSNLLTLPSPAISARHAIFKRTANGWTISDLDSFNGTFVNGEALTSELPLVVGDVITMADISMVLLGSCVYFTDKSSGVDVVADNLVQIRKTRKGSRVTNDHVSLHFKRGDFVAIVGGSGSGKSTLLNGLNGSDPAAEGKVYIDGVDLYQNYGVLKNAIGYVPQQDIVYDDLKLVDMLNYAAQLRMPPDTTRSERDARVNEVLDQLKLNGERDNYIGRLSGGQKKRASIAVEMLADPKLFFLDEPTSGLDPGIEKHLMRTLAEMSDNGRTIIVVTHTTLNLDLCDQVVFLAPGGKLCYAGDPKEALPFFGVDDFVDVYDKIADEPLYWERRFAEYRNDTGAPTKRNSRVSNKKKNPSFVSQLKTLTSRYSKLVINDRMRTLLLIAQAPLLAALICLVAGDGCFEVYEGTQSCLFALSCAAFWIGILNSIQEICKERTILQREYIGGMKIGAYVLSKLVVLGILCVVQSLLLTVVFCSLKGMPSESLINAGLELFVTTLMTTLSAMCLGLAVSALFKNADRAIAVAPLLIMPQILFSGLIFKLEGVAETISVFVNCRWGMEAYGTTANLNALDYEIYQKSDMITPDIYEHEWESAYDYAIGHLFASWEILLVFCVVCSVFAGVAVMLSLRSKKG